MQRTSLTDLVLSRIGSRPALTPSRLLVVGLLIAAMLAGMTYCGTTAIYMIIGGHSPRTVRHEISVGSTRLLVPENLIRDAHDRRSGRVERLELYMHWPTLDGYSFARSNSFNHQGRKDIVFVSVTTDTVPGAWLDNSHVYYTGITHPGERGPAGLMFRPFKEGNGFEDEVLAIGLRSPQPAFTARCLTGEMAVRSLAPCERRLPFTESTNLIYRFPEALLPDWQMLDETISMRLEAMLQG